MEEVPRPSLQRITEARGPASKMWVTVHGRNDGACSYDRAHPSDATVPYITAIVCGHIIAGCCGEGCIAFDGKRTHALWCKSAL